jgi:endonuclease YncB( thermonuclease family)
LVRGISVTRNCRATMHVTHIARRLGPTLADVILPDGTNVNHTLVKDGWYWWYRKYASAHHSLVQSLTPHPPTPCNALLDQLYLPQRDANRRG